MNLLPLLGGLAGGVGLFLLGMGLMTDGLKLAAGPALERILARSTQTRLRGLATGALVTIAVQSSSAVTVAAIGFVNAGLLLDDRVPPSEWRDLYRGHEVACHTCLHPTIARSPLDQVARQILEDRQGLESVHFVHVGIEFHDTQQDVIRAWGTLAGIHHGRFDLKQIVLKTGNGARFVQNERYQGVFHRAQRIGTDSGKREALNGTFEGVGEFHDGFS